MQDVSVTDNILSLDPMYSQLHHKISKRFYGKKLAILSSYGLKNYLPDFECHYIEKIIRTSSINISNADVQTVNSIQNHYAALVNKIEKRVLTTNELEYMAKFYVFLKGFIIREDIKLVLLHNDLRWQHAIAIKICKDLQIKYLVTEQGLFRPHTTVVDNCGVNANSSVKNDYQSFLDKDVVVTASEEVVTSAHDSFYSYTNFFIYILLSKIGRLIGTESRIVHKRHAFSEYLRRFYLQRVVPLALRKKLSGVDNQIGVDKPFVFIPMQLELDTQLLVHSDFCSNQEVIDIIEASFEASGLKDKYDLVFKLHPNDQQKYSFSSFSKLTSSVINSSFLKNASLVVSVNSSALLQVLFTATPVITLGRSIYDVPECALYSNSLRLASDIQQQINVKIDLSKRNRYVRYLNFEYSIQGAGNSFSEKQIDKILDKYIKVKESCS